MTDTIRIWKYQSYQEYSIQDSRSPEVAHIVSCYILFLFSEVENYTQLLYRKGILFVIFYFYLTHVPHTHHSFSRYPRYRYTHTSPARYHSPLWRRCSMEPILSGNLLSRYVPLRARIRATLRPIWEKKSPICHHII